MERLLIFVAIIVIAVVTSTLAYKLMPFRRWTDRKPGFVLFPKYVAQARKSLPAVRASLEALGFRESRPGLYTRGKFYGDFSVEAIKLNVEVDDNGRQVRVYAAFFGVLFDEGDLWQLTSDIINA